MAVMDERIGRISEIEELGLADKYNKALEYFNNNEKPDQDLCPEVVQYWKNTEGNVYYGNITGKRSKYEDEVLLGNASTGSWYREYYKRTPSSYGYEGFYIKYIKELDALEFSVLCMDGTRGKDGEKREWNFSKCERYISYRNDTNIYSDKYGVYIGRKYWNKELVDVMGQHLSDAQNRRAIAKEFLKFSDNMVCVDYSKKKIDDPWLWSVRECYKKNFIPRSKRKSAATDVMNIELEDVDFDVIDNEIATAHFEKVNDDWFVFRFARLAYDWYTKIYSVEQEGFRIYVPNNTKDKLIITESYSGNWNRTTVAAERLQLMGWRSIKRIDIVEKDNLSECIRTKYVKDIIDWTTTTGIKMFIDCFRHPVIEQMVKIGLGDMAKAIMDNDGTPSTIKYFFGVKEKKQPIYKLLGISKGVVKKLKELNNGNYQLRAVRELKKMFGVDISSLSTKTLDEFGFLFDDNFWDRSNVRTLEDLVRGYSFGYWHNSGDCANEKYSDEYVDKIIHAIRVSNKSKTDNVSYDIEVFTLIRDIYRMERDAIEAGIDTEDYRCKHDLEIIHDNLVTIRNIREEEARARWNEHEKERLEKTRKQFEKLQEERIEKFEEVGDKYAIIVPKELNDLVVEGSRLHHCVGSYVERHGRGDTNILFLRKTDEIDTPFYTVEVTNGDYVVQVHGSHNKWLGNNPEAIPFLYQYFKKHNFKFDNNLLLNLGAGYGASDEKLSEDYLVGVA